MKEIWKDIEGYEGLYQISSLGAIRSLDRKVKSRLGYRNVYGKILKQYINKKGYNTITLKKGNTIRTLRVHQLVAKAFISNPKELPEINHIDANKRNNSVLNLEWCTKKENVAHSIRHSLFDYDIKRQKVIVIFNSIKEASEMLNIDRNKICRRLDKDKDYKGIYFRRLKEIVQ